MYWYQLCVIYQWFTLQCPFPCLTTLDVSRVVIHAAGALLEEKEGRLWGLLGLESCFFVAWELLLLLLLLVAVVAAVWVELPMLWLVRNGQIGAGLWHSRSVHSQREEEIYNEDREFVKSSLSLQQLLVWLVLATASLLRAIGRIGTRMIWGMVFIMLHIV